MAADRQSIPTLFRGIQYRSRLEARWAAMFDQLGLTYEYEPFDLEGWIPDFALTCGAVAILVEIKPVFIRHEPRCVMDKIDATTWDGPVFLLGCEIGRDDLDMPCPGWMRQPRAASDPESGWWGELAFGSWNSVVGFTSVQGAWLNLTGQGTGKYYLESEYLWYRISEAWKAAANAVQWRGLRSEAK